jgi:hypothetical protein
MTEDASEASEKSLSDVAPTMDESNVCYKLRDDGTMILYECKTGETFMEGKFMVNRE